MKIVDVGVLTREFASIKPLIYVQDTLRRAEQLQLLEAVLVGRMSAEGEQQCRYVSEW
jgi:hypothetical protein